MLAQDDSIGGGSRVWRHHPRGRRQGAPSPGRQRVGTRRVESRFEPRSYGFRPGRGCH